MFEHARKSHVGAYAIMTVEVVIQSSSSASFGEFLLQLDETCLTTLNYELFLSPSDICDCRTVEERTCSKGYFWFRNICLKRVCHLTLSLYINLCVSLSSSGGVSISGAHAVARYLCRLAPSGVVPLYGATNLEKAEVDHWLEYSIIALTQRQGATPTAALKHLDSILGPRVYLVGYEMTLADLAVYGAVRGECVGR